MDTDTFHFYATHPQHFGAISHADISYLEHNALCGDDITVFLHIQGDTIREWSFVGEASMVTIACSGLFGDIVQGVSIAEVMNWGQADIQGLTDMRVSSRRERAQMLPLLATRNALHQYWGDGMRDDFGDIMSVS